MLKNIFEMLRRLYLSVVLLFLSCSLFGQTLRLQAHCSSEGLKNGKYGLYAYGSWGPDTTSITMSLGKGTISVNGIEYEVLERPKKWIIRNDYKFCTFQCTTPNYEKVAIKLFRFDKGPSKICILGERKATRYVCYENKH